MIEAPEIVIACDTREPLHGGWCYHFESPTVRKGLEIGDYSILGTEADMALERKTLDDLLACLTRERRRFEVELRRATRLSRFAVVVEGSWNDLIAGRYASKMAPTAAFASVVSFWHRYCLPFIFAEDQPTAAKIAEAYLCRWAQERFNGLRELERAVRRHAKEPAA